MKKVFYTFAILAISLMSCDSNSDSIDTTNNDNILPTKVDIVYSGGETETIEFTYNGMTLIKEQFSNGDYTDYVYEDNKLAQINLYFASDSDILESYTYDAQGRVATIATNIVGTGIYEYNLTYNADNTVITSNSITFPKSEPSSSTISKGNIIEDNDSEVYITKFTHDDKNAPFKNIVNRSILLSISSEVNVNYMFNMNNVLTNLTPHDSDPQNIKNSYTYTDLNYPRTVKENNNGDISTYTYTYNND